MLKVTIPTKDYYDDRSNEFVMTSAVELELEHSLASLSKWESKWEIPYFSDEAKSDEQVLDYIRCMVTNTEVDISVIMRMENEDLIRVKEHIEAKMTATWFSGQKQSGPAPVVTNEVIYYWMVENGIPFECENWHLNRLLTLIKVCGEKRKPEKKMSSSEIADRNRRLNEERLKKYNTTG